jgi:hypothetical protein
MDHRCEYYERSDFRGVDRHGNILGRLAPQPVAIVVKRYCELAGLDPANMPIIRCAPVWSRRPHAQNDHFAPKVPSSKKCRLALAHSLHPTRAR